MDHRGARTIQRGSPRFAARTTVLYGVLVAACSSDTSVFTSDAGLIDAHTSGGATSSGGTAGTTPSAGSTSAAGTTSSAGSTSSGGRDASSGSGGTTGADGSLGSGGKASDSGGRRIGDAGPDSSSDSGTTDDAGPVASCSVECCGSADAGAADAGGRILADSVRGFSARQGACGWSYGYLTGGSEPFMPVQVYNSSQDPPAWEESAAHPPWIGLSATAAHPNQSPRQWAARRWTSTVRGTISVRGHLAKLATAGGDGVTGRIHVDGIEVWSQTLRYDDAAGTDFVVSADVRVGSALDLLVDPVDTDLYDGTIFTAVVAE